MSVGMRAGIYVVLGIGALAVVVPAQIADLVPGPLFLLGLSIVFVGLAMYLWTTWDFITVGQGTALPLDPPRALVASGLYRIVRNPMALGFVLILTGEAVAFGSRSILAYAAIVFLVIHLFVVLVEEPGLRRRFGTSYAEYCHSVPRWFPRVRRKPRGN